AIAAANGSCGSGGPRGAGGRGGPLLMRTAGGAPHPGGATHSPPPMYRPPHWLRANIARTGRPPHRPSGPRPANPPAAAQDPRFRCVAGMKPWLVLSLCLATLLASLPARADDLFDAEVHARRMKKAGAGVAGVGFVHLAAGLALTFAVVGMDKSCEGRGYTC